MSAEQILWALYAIYRHRFTPRTAYRKARHESRQPLSF